MAVAKAKGKAYLTLVILLLGLAIGACSALHTIKFQRLSIFLKALQESSSHGKDNFHKQYYQLKAQAQRYQPPS
jgi:uncharacterized protein YxeA